MRTLAPVFLAATGAIVGCHQDPVAGRLEISVSGGAYVEDTIPAAAFSDGWSVTFSKFLVTVDWYIWLERPDGVAGLSLIDPSVFDLAQPSNGAGHPYAYRNGRTIAPGTYDHVEWDIRDPRRASPGNAEPADVEEMRRRRLSVRVVGTATRGTQTVTFDWGFPYAVRHAWCPLDPVEIDGNTVAIRLDVAGERLFHTGLVSDPPTFAFDHIAASDGADGSAPDGAVTDDELAAANIDDLMTELLGTMGGVDGRRCADVNVTPPF